MLQIKSISKQYKTGDLVQNALSDVSLNLRDNEFVSILGPSGSGKTTLLNIIGGLDRYDSGDLIINGISTKAYKDKDWDSYRNHTIGFVFQSYNLIPHQSVLSNVELALTISGISKSERRKRARKALMQVGLGDQLHKKPNQMSGGQMQRVAIARALVNNPDILLADEPTGALDTETSIQIMELLQEVAKDRLVVMVTHNPELAEQYSTRIVKLRDGRITDDSDPYEPKAEIQTEPEHKNMGRAKMSFLTSLSLSFNNLRTKKGRTLLTSFAGSIGIIGIALILALSSGVNLYISDIQKDTMTSYPITISSETVDMSSMMGAGGGMMGGMTGGKTDSETNLEDGVYADYSGIEVTASSVVENNLTEFKQYLDNPDSEIHQYLGENGIAYTYNINFDVYSYDSDEKLVNSNTDTENITGSEGQGEFGAGAGNMGNMSMMMNDSASSSDEENFSELMKGADGDTVSKVITDSYDVLYGAWPEEYNEVVLVMDENNSIDAGTLYQLGLITADEYIEITDQIENGEEIEERFWNYEEISEHSFYMVPASDRYVKNGDGTFAYLEDDEKNYDVLLENSVELKITGIVKPVEDAENASISTSVAYTSKLTDYVIEHTNESQVVLAQEETPEINVLNDMEFEEGTSYEENMEAFGKVSYDAPASISIYTDSFENKEAVSDCISKYNETAGEDNQITYTDYVELMTSSLTSIVDVISYVLIAFVAVSLIVSCIMISIITHISVLERTKEIGILRAMGASKRNISQVFNAETFIIGCCAGILGIGISLLLSIPINAILQNLLGAATLSVSLPITYAAILVVISIVITVIGGLLPAKKAAKKDPVIALRTE